LFGIFGSNWQLPAYLTDEVFPRFNFHFSFACPQTSAGLTRPLVFLVFGRQILSLLTTLPFCFPTFFGVPCFPWSFPGLLFVFYIFPVSFSCFSPPLLFFLFHDPSFCFLDCREPVSHHFFFARFFPISTLFFQFHVRFQTFSSSPLFFAAANFLWALSKVHPFPTCPIESLHFLSVFFHVGGTLHGRFFFFSLPGPAQ